MNKYKFTIPGRPGPKQRHQHHARSGIRDIPHLIARVKNEMKEGKCTVAKAIKAVIRKQTGTFSPPGYEKYKTHVAACARKAGIEPMYCCRMSIKAFTRRNKSNDKISGNKPDLEGVFGVIADAIEGIAYIKDWSIFEIGNSENLFVKHDEKEFVIVYLEERDPDQYIVDRVLGKLMRRSGYTP